MPSSDPQPARTPAPQAPPHAPGPQPAPALIAAIVCAGVVLVNVDLFIVNVAVPAMSRSWPGADLADLSWVLSGYAVVFAALLVPAGRLADRSGHRATFLRGTALFTAASALCAAAPGVGWLVAARLLQAAGAAVLMPASLGLLVTSYPPEKRAAIVRVWAALGGLAAAVGPVLGGLLVEPGWRWIFLINVPIGIAAVAVGSRVLPVGPSTRTALPDLLGSAVFAAAVGALALGLVKADAWGWASPRSLAAWAVAAVLAAWFAVRTTRHPVPVLEPAILRVRAFGVAGLTSVLFGLAFAGMLLGITLFTQQVWGWSALRTGIAFTPGPLLVPPTSILAGRFAARVGPGRLAAAGGVLFAAGTAWWAITLDTGSAYAASMLPGMLLTGVGTGLMLPTLVAAAATALPPQHAATGTGAVTMLRQLGAVLGVSITVVLLGTAPTTAGFDRVWYLITAASLAGAATGLLLGPGQRRAAREPGGAPAYRAEPEHRAEGPERSTAADAVTARTEGTP